MRRASRCAFAHSRTFTLFSSALRERTNCARIGRMGVVILSAVDPYPVDAGKKVVLSGFIDYFSTCYGAENVHYIKIGKPPRAPMPVPVHVIEGPPISTVALNVATKVPLGCLSLQEAFLSSRRTAEGINRVLDEIDPTLQVYDTIRMAQYAPTDVAAHQVCYLDDLFSERYEGMLRAGEKYADVDISPLGGFAEHIPRRLRPFANHRVGQALLLRAERMLVRRSEVRVANRFRRSLLINDAEADVLRQRTGLSASRIMCAPPLVAQPNSPRRDYRGAPDFTFIGLLSLPHNDDGLRWFLREVWPLVLQQLPDAKLQVVGREPRPELTTMAAELADSVSLMGYVPDLDGVLGQTAAMINPLRFGSGIKLKVIEALGRAIPVVSTPVGAEGLHSGPDSGLLIRKQPSEIAEALCALTDPTFNAEISNKARAQFDSQYARQPVFAAYDAAFA